jgi:hypothetical protein
MEWPRQNSSALMLLCRSFFRNARVAIADCPIVATVFTGAAVSLPTLSSVLIEIIAEYALSSLDARGPGVLCEIIVQLIW